MPVSQHPIAIPVTTRDTGVGTANAVPVLNEIRHALQRFLREGEPTTIDLANLPFDSDDTQALRDLLGAGEVRARVDALGLTEIRETCYPGVWWVDYRMPEEGRPLVHIEITDIPSLLRTPVEAMNDSLRQLQDRLDDLLDSFSS